jgi:hypothetical protein
MKKRGRRDEEEQGREERSQREKRGKDPNFFI